MATDIRQSLIAWGSVLLLVGGFWLLSHWGIGLPALPDWILWPALLIVPMLDVGWRTLRHIKSKRMAEATDGRH